MSKIYFYQIKEFEFEFRLFDIKDSCQIDYHGEKIEFNVRELIYLNKLGEGNFGLVNLVQIQNQSNVILASKVCFVFNFIN